MSLEFHEKSFQKFSDACKRRGRGFTLIELLVVIAIIGVLSAVVLASLNSARAKANDSKRLSDMRQFATALELYYDANGHYPIVGTGPGVWACFDSLSYRTSTIINPNAADLTTAMLPYISSPKDPKPVGGQSGYLYTANAVGSQYCILIYQTPQNMNNYPAAMVDYYSGRCGTVGSNGQCSGTNAIYLYQGATYANGC